MLAENLTQPGRLAFEFGSLARFLASALQDAQGVKASQFLPAAARRTEFGIELRHVREDADIVENDQATWRHKWRPGGEVLTDRLGGVVAVDEKQSDRPLPTFACLGGGADADIHPLSEFLCFKVAAKHGQSRAVPGEVGISMGAIAPVLRRTTKMINGHDLGTTAIPATRRQPAGGTALEAANFHGHTVNRPAPRQGIERESLGRVQLAFNRIKPLGQALELEAGGHGLSQGVEGSLQHAVLDRFAVFPNRSLEGAVASFLCQRVELDFAVFEAGPVEEEIEMTARTDMIFEQGFVDLGNFALPP